MTVTASDDPRDTAPLAPIAFTPTYTATSPRAVVIIDGNHYPFTRAVISDNAHGATGTATVTMPISSNPDYTVALFRDETNDAPVYVEIWAGYPDNIAIASTSIEQLQRRFVGEIDIYSAQFHEDQVTFSCRSLASSLVDDKITGVSTNEPVVDFLQKQCAKYGLPDPVITLPDTTARPITIAEVLGHDQVGGARFSTFLYGLHPWDLLIRAAQIDDVDVWEDITTGAIHYEAPDVIERVTVPLQFGRDWIGLSASHSPRFNKHIRVYVHSYQPRTRIGASTRYVRKADGSVQVSHRTGSSTSSVIMGTSSSQTVTQSVGEDGTVSTGVSTSSTAGGASTGTGQQGPSESRVERYVIWVPNKTPQQVSQIARARWRQISMHEYAIEGEVAMTPALLGSLSITSLLRITGTPYVKANTNAGEKGYWARAITETIGVDDGWVLRIQAINHEPPANAV